MGKTAFPPKLEATDTTSEPLVPQPKPRPRLSVKQVLAVVSSLRLTVVLFAFAIVLVFCGTLAQVDADIWTVVEKYFRSAFVWVPLQLFFPRAVKVPGMFPFLGGWLIGGLLLVNLLAAHVVRFRISWKRSGILLIHAGLIVLMLSELVTGLFAVEAKMSIAEGEAVNFVDESREYELALTNSSDPKTDEVVVIPGRVIRYGGIIRNDLLPVDVDIVQFLKNSDLVPLRDGEESGPDTLTTTNGWRFRLVAKGEEKGVDSSARENAAAVRVTFRKKDTGESLGTYFLSQWLYANFSNRFYQFAPQHLRVDGKTYTVELRNKRDYRPYTIYLKKFTHAVYPGTTVPKDFASEIRLVNTEQQEDRETRIYMNNPLRYAGETVYQIGYFPDDSGTILQVVRNPGWLMPYVSCAMVALGMIIHFGLHLVGFLRLRMVS
jgi:hypothetical protein